MITRINDFNNKSFHNYSGPDENFREKNIIFGYNGSGKTSLVFGLENTFLNISGNKKENLRIYSADYIDKYLLLDPTNRRSIRGIRAIFGEKNVDIEEEIKELENKIINQDEIDKLTDENTFLDIEAKSEIVNIFNTKKGSLRIQGKTTALSIKDTVNAYEEDLKNAFKVEKDRINIEKIIGDDSLVKRISAIESLEEVPEISSDYIDYIEFYEKQNQRYDDVKIPNSTIIKWLTEGLTFHNEKTHCEFCGSPIDYPSIKSKVDSYTKNVKFTAENFFRNIHNYLNEKIILVKNVLSKKELYSAQINYCEILFNELKEAMIPLEEFTTVLKYNYENITLIQKIIVDDLRETIRQVSNITLKINSLLEETISLERAKLDKLGTLVKGAVSIAISKSTLINRNINKIENNKHLITMYNRENEKTWEKIKSLKESKTVAGDFMKLVNDILTDINVSIKLDIEGNDYYLRTTLLNEDELTVDEISEGEKNLLSLIFFYFEMFEDDKQSVLKRDIKMIILDDPISSMDDSNRFYVLELVKNIIELNVDQVFVLSHVWDDYCQLIYGNNCFNPDSEFASFEIRKNNESEIKRNNSQGNPYKFMFKEIYDLSQKSTLSTSCDYFHIPNILRKVFEEFLFFKTNKYMLAQNSRKREIEDLFKIISISEKTKLRTLLAVSNVLSHTNTKTNEDILASAKYLMKLIKKHDKLHYDAMKKE